MTNFCTQPQLEAALIIVYHLFNIFKQRFTRKKLLFLKYIHKVHLLIVHLIPKVISLIDFYYCFIVEVIRSVFDFWFSISTCDSTVKKNLTYIENPGNSILQSKLWHNRVLTIATNSYLKTIINKVIFIIFAFCQKSRGQEMIPGTKS